MEKKKYFIQKIFHCPENPTPFDLMKQKWYPEWTRINGYEKLLGAEQGLQSILKKQYKYDNNCSFRIVDKYGGVQ